MATRQSIHTKYRNSIQISELNNKTWPQYTAATIATLGSLCIGCFLGWTAPALPYLRPDTHHNGTNETHLYVDEYEGSWIGSLVALGAAIGALPAGYLGDQFGRKTLLLALGILFTLSWILIIVLPNSLIAIYASRTIAGLATGATCVVTPIYNEEIAEIRVRGILGSFVDLQMSIGVLFVYVIGMVPYVWINIACALLAIIFFFTMIWIPESPMYLVSKGRDKEAEQALCWLRGAKTAEFSYVKIEFEYLKETINSVEVRRESKAGSGLSLKEILVNRLGLSGPSMKAIGAVFGLMVFQQLSGINALVFYLEDVFADSGVDIEANIAAIIVALAEVIATCVAAVLVEHTGRRFLLIVSNFGMAVCLGILVAYFYFVENEEVTSLSWMPIAALSLYVVLFAFGVGPLPWLMMAEMLPVEAKGWAGAMSVAINWAIAFVVTRFFNDSLNHLGNEITYGIFCVVCVVAGIFVFVAVPETKGKTRDEIQEAFGKKIED